MCPYTHEVLPFRGEKNRELAQPWRDKQRLEPENETLKRAAGYFARENVLPIERIS